MNKVLEAGARKHAIQRKCWCQTLTPCSVCQANFRATWKAGVNALTDEQCIDLALITEGESMNPWSYKSPKAFRAALKAVVKVDDG